MPGLHPELQAKLVGMEGDMDKMVAKACFEETKRKELAAVTPANSLPRRTPTSRGATPASTSRPQPTLPTQPHRQVLSTKPAKSTPPTNVVTSGGGSSSTNEPQGRETTGGRDPKCFHCGLGGHLVRKCPYRSTSTEGQESTGGRQMNMAINQGATGGRQTNTATTPGAAQGPRVSNVTSQELAEGTPSKSKQEMEDLHEKLRRAELAEALKDASSTGVLNAMSSAESAGKSRLGPSVLYPVEVNEVPTDALVDTGSPATIILLQFALKVLAKHRRSDETAQWREAAQKKFHDPDVILKSYGRQELDSIAQIELTLSHCGQEVMKTLLVRKDAPNHVLIGTDVQPELGFSLVVSGVNGKATNLFDGKEVIIFQSH